MDGDKVVCVVLTESTELSLVQKALEEGGCVVRNLVHPKFTNLVLTPNPNPNPNPNPGSSASASWSTSPWPWSTALRYAKPNPNPNP